jgi:hypothetical protein
MCAATDLTCVSEVVSKIASVQQVFRQMYKCAASVQQVWSWWKEAWELGGSSSSVWALQETFIHGGARETASGQLTLWQICRVVQTAGGHVV